MNEAINLQAKFDKFHNHWSPKVIAEMNNYQFKLVKIEGDFIWHMHKETDEVFLVIKGNMGIEFRDHTLYLSTGEMAVVARGIEHKPFAEEECHIMIIEPKGVVNTGDAGGERTAEDQVFI